MQVWESSHIMEIPVDHVQLLALVLQLSQSVCCKLLCTFCSLKECSAG